MFEGGVEIEGIYILGGPLSKLSLGWEIPLSNNIYVIYGVGRSQLSCSARGVTHLLSQRHRRGRNENKNQEIRQYNTPTATEVPGTHTPTTIYTLSLQSFAVLSVVVARIDSCISETIKE
jgi:hypothetical protein